MSSRTVNECDVKGNHSGEVYVQKLLPVIWTTEQNEGRPTVPYLDWEKLDICKGHFDYLIDKREILTVDGAMGFNTYYFKNKSS